MASYRRLKPTYDQLQARQQVHQLTFDEIGRRQRAIEEQRATLDTTSDYALRTFNEAVNAWNAENEQFKADLAAFDGEVEAYNRELEVVGRRIR